MRIILILAFMWAGLVSAQTKVYYVAASVDTVVYDSVMVNEYIEVIDSIYDNVDDEYMHITLSQLELDTFQVAVLNNHRANWSYSSGMDVYMNYFSIDVEEVFDLTEPADIANKLTYINALTGISFSNTPDIKLKLIP